MATITDIAKMASVSISTVSRVLNYDDSLSVTDETKRKVFIAAEALNYTKFKKKQMIQDKKKLNASTGSKIKTVGLIQWLVGKEELDDVYYMSIRIGAEKRAQELGYSIVNITENISIPDSLAGIIAIGKFDESTINYFSDLTDHLVLIGSNFPINNFDTVNSDFTLATEIALNYLQNQGHKKIAFIGAEEQNNMHGYRTYKTPVTNAYRDVMKSLNLFSEDYFFVDTNTHLSVEAGKSLTKRALSKWQLHLPTAILAANDAMAIGVIQELSSQNIRIPNDISVMGINDLSFSQYVSPPLTTVKVFTEEMGAVGFETLHQQIQNPSINRRITLATELIVRSSVAKI